MRRLITIVMTFVLCGATSLAQGEWDKKKVKEDWDKIVDYVAVVYTQAVIEPKSNLDEYSQYKDKALPNYKQVELGNVDGEKFSKDLKANNWKTTSKDVTDKILNKKILDKKSEPQIEQLLRFATGVDSYDKHIAGKREDVTNYLKGFYWVTPQPEPQNIQTPDNTNTGIRNRMEIKKEDEKVAMDYCLWL